MPLTAILRDHLAPLVRGSLAIVVCYALFYISTVYTLGYGVRALGIPRTTFLGVLCGAIVFMALATPLSAALADRFGRRPVLLVSAVLAIAVGLAMPALLSAGIVGVFIFLALALGVMGLTFAPLGALLPELFPVPVATPARRARTMSAASSAPRSRRRWRRSSRRTAASPGSAITSRSPARSAFSRCSPCGRRWNSRGRWRLAPVPQTCYAPRLHGKNVGERPVASRIKRSHHELQTWRKP